MFLDTSGLMCLFDRKETRHAAAIEHYNRSAYRVSHNYVLAEFVALAVARRAPISQVLAFVEALANSDEVMVTWVDQALHQRAMALLLDRSDKAWTLCDAVSFVLMSDRAILESLTTDHDFDQAGFVRLLVR
jgi:predicted nucleic acid-binding protein